MAHDATPPDPAAVAASPATPIRDPHGTFPLRVAAVDVGSNALRYKVAEFESKTNCTQLASGRAPVRLGHAAFLTGSLSADAMDRAVEALAGFARVFDDMGVGLVKGVATSAVRETRNGPGFAQRVREETGIDLYPISGSEEARLVWTAVRSRVQLGDAKWMLVDLGGGSVEVSLADRNGLMWTESHTMGSVRLLEELSGASDPPARFAGLLADYASTLRIPHASRHWTPVGLIATGGNIEDLARLAGQPRAPGLPHYKLSREQLRGAIARLSGMTTRQRVTKLGMREDRADVVLPAAIVYDRVAELAGAEEVIVPFLGVQDGLLVDAVEEACEGDDLGREERTALEGALSLGRRYLFDEAHGRHVATLALSLFDQLAGVHGLAAADRRLLLAGAVLHDIGLHVSHRKHHKHSRYLIQNSEISGVSISELPIVALLARYHRRAAPRPSHYLYRDLDGATRARVRRLAAILRVADSLDREHLQRVISVRVRQVAGGLELHLEKTGRTLLEEWALRRKGGLFASEFGQEPVVAGPEKPAAEDTAGLAAAGQVR